VIASLLSANSDPASPLYRMIDPQKVAVIGHSDGGDVSLAVAANSCCRDPAVRAAVILSGAELAGFGGSYFAGGSVPLLAVQGSADTVNVPACSVELYDQAPAPKYYLDVAGAQHQPPYLWPGPTRAGVSTTVIAFLDAYLKSRPSRLAAIARGRGLPSGESLSSGSAAPLASGTDCPGA